MRDFFDVFALAERCRFESRPLAEAIRATVERRRTAIPAEPPLALTPDFAGIEGKRAQWAAFVRRNRIETAPADLRSAIAGIAAFVGPALAASARGAACTGTWPPGGPWQ